MYALADPNLCLPSEGWPGIVRSQTERVEGESILATLPSIFPSYVGCRLAAPPLTTPGSFPLLCRLCIVNDQLFIRKATNKEIRKAFVMPAPTPSSSPVPTLTAEQQEMLQNFSLQSGMNLEWSQK